MNLPWNLLLAAPLFAVAVGCAEQDSRHPTGDPIDVVSAWEQPRRIEAPPQDAANARRVAATKQAQETADLIVAGRYAEALTRFPLVASDRATALSMLTVQFERMGEFTIEMGAPLKMVQHPEIATSWAAMLPCTVGKRTEKGDMFTIHTSWLGISDDGGQTWGFLRDAHMPWVRDTMYRISPAVTRRLVWPQPSTRVNGVLLNVPLRTLAEGLEELKDIP